MKIRATFKLLLLMTAVLTILSSVASAQKIEITTGPEEISENSYWQLTISVHNGDLKTYDGFPEIKGFRKAHESYGSGTTIINGRMSSVQSRIMNYYPVQKGVIVVPTLQMKVNGQTITVPGKKVTVRKSSNQRPQQPNSAFPRMDDFFNDEEPEYVEVEDDAFLALTTDKSEVYVGEGVNATLAFYRSENNRAVLQFYDISKQLTDILKKLKPTNCWEENFNIEDIEGERVTLNGKNYIRFKIYEAMFYPFNTETIKFPAVNLEMIKYKIAKSPSYFRPNSQEDFKTFTSKAKTVTVKELPPHPLRNSVAVGEYKLAEKIANTNIETGASTAYEFNVYGEGNIASLPNPVTRGDNTFEIYDPNIKQEVSRSGNRITGNKSFRYFMIPKEPGKYNLSKYFQWVYFSPARGRYDTLSSKLVVNITGESKRNEAIESYDPGNFYDGTSVADNTLRSLHNTNWQKWVFNAFVLVMVGTSAFLLIKK